MTPRDRKTADWRHNDRPGRPWDAPAVPVLSQDWTAEGTSRWTRADRRARVTQDTYQPVWTAETADGSRRRFYRFPEAIQWADRWPALGPTLDDPAPVRAAAVEIPRS